MNRGPRGNAHGFQLQSLLKIADTKSSKQKDYTLLHYIVHVIDDMVRARIVFGRLALRLLVAVQDTFIACVQMCHSLLTAFYLFQAGFADIRPLTTELASVMDAAKVMLAERFGCRGETLPACVWSVEISITPCTHGFPQVNFPELSKDLAVLRTGMNTVKHELAWHKSQTSPLESDLYEVSGNWRKYR